jgi:hypothetical protein
MWEVMKIIQAISVYHREWTVSGPEGGIAISPVANTECHPLLDGGGAYRMWY